jgi:phosphatidylglycerophosphate synthase
VSQIESTYKGRDVEETIDIYFYRPLGYIVALACKSLRVTPNAVTISSILIGVACGHLLYYPDIALNGWGLLLWVIADVLDSADGQLARMTNHESKFGRILDGLATNIIFISIYGHLFARVVAAGGSSWLFILVLASAFSHSIQSALADYYRNAYIKFVADPSRSELERSAEIRAEYHSISFSQHPFRKFLLRIYLNYTVEQELFSKNFQALRNRVDEKFDCHIPQWFADEYRRTNKPLIKYYAMLTTNTRVIIMAVCVLINQVQLYFWAEVVALNAVMVIVTVHQEDVSKMLLRQIDMETVTK